MSNFPTSINLEEKLKRFYLKITNIGESATKLMLVHKSLMVVMTSPTLKVASYEEPSHVVFYSICLSPLLEFFSANFSDIQAVQI